MLKPENLIIEARNKAKDRIGQISLKDIKSLEIVLNHNNVGTWSISLSADHPLIKTLRKKGAGIVVATDTGTIISGNMTSVKYEYSGENPAGIAVVSGVDDNQYLADQLAYPDPAHNAEAQTKDKDTRTGEAETILKQFVNYNIGPGAISSRKVSNLIIEADEARGPIMTKSARWKKLGLLCYQIATVADLGFRIAQAADKIRFEVYEPVDRTGETVWSVENNNVTRTDFQFNSPTVTHAIVGGAGKGTDRMMEVYSTTASATAATDWGRRIEVFVDTKESDTTAELNQAGAEAIKGGLVTSNTEIIPADATTTYMTNWNLGDIVKVKINDDIELAAIIDSVGIVLNNEGITIKASVNKSNLQSSVSSAINNLETTAEGSSTAFKRATLIVTTPTLASGESWKSSVVIAAGFRLLSVGSNHSSRIRFYSNTTGQTADESRDVLGYPDDIGLLLDMVVPHNGSYTLNLSPTVDGYTSTGSSIVPITIENRASSPQAIEITIVYIRTE